MGKKIKRKHSKSSGMKKMRDCTRRANALERKARRWDKNRERGKRVSKNNKTTSRGKNWDTSGLLKQAAFLRSVS